MTNTCGRRREPIGWNKWKAQVLGHVEMDDASAVVSEHYENKEDA